MSRRGSLKSKDEQEKLQRQKCWPTSRLFCMYQWRDLKRHKFHFCLAFCSVFIIVLSILIVISMINKGPVIFLKMSEGRNGQIDAFLTPAGVEQNIHDLNQKSFVNLTALRVAEERTSKKYNVSPRKIYCNT